MSGVDGQGRPSDTVGLRRLLAEAVARRIYAEGPDGEVNPTALVDELEPVVTAWAEQRARERAAEVVARVKALPVYEVKDDDDLLGHVLIAQDVLDALAADDRTGIDRG